MNEQALMQLLLEHLKVTESLVQDHIRLSQLSPNFSPSPEFANMISTIRLQRQRVEAIVGH
jgi:hypothetical protein